MTTALAERKADAVTNMVAKLEASFETALPSHVTKEHFARALTTQIRKSPKLMKCTPDSLAISVVTAAQLGLMLGINGAGWLVPFAGECTLMIGYQGMVDLCYRSGFVASVFADVVCENDEFDFEQGLNRKLRHIPNLRGSRGKPYAVYAIAEIKEVNAPLFVVLNEEEVYTVKDASPGAKKSDSPWNGKFETEMWKKTALRRLTKLLPKSVELNNALEFENQQEERLREVSARTVDDDLLSPGRHNTRRVSAPKHIETVEPTDDDLAAMQDAKRSEAGEQPKDYAYLNAIFNDNPELIDAAMKDVGLPYLPDLIWQDLTPEDLGMLAEARKTVEAKLKGGKS